MKFVQADPASSVYFTSMTTPLGELVVYGCEGPTGAPVVLGVQMVEQAHARAIGEQWLADDGVLDPVVDQIDAYFDRDLKDFELDLSVSGSPFQVRVWQTLAKIPYGTTISYGELAMEVGSPGASRAVGSANGRNPIAVIIPCHRVIAAGGKLGGYGGGLHRKQLLLDLEQLGDSSAQALI